MRFVVRWSVAGVLALVAGQSFEPVGRAAAAGGPSLAAISLNPGSVVGGTPSTGTITLTGRALLGGFVVNLSSSNTSAATVPGSVTVPAGAASVDFTATTYPVAFNPNVVPAGVSVTITAAHWDGFDRRSSDSMTDSLLVMTPMVKSVAVWSPVSGSTSGNASAIGVTLTGPAPASGVTIFLSSSDPGVASPEQTSVTLTGGTSATVPLNVTPVSVQTTVQLSAHRGVFDNKSATLTVLPPSLSQVACGDPSYNACSTIGGSVGPGKVWLDAEVPSGAGMQVQLASSDSHLVSVPSAVTVPAGRKSVEFSFTTAPVASPTDVTITATYNGIARSARVTVLAPRVQSLSLNPTNVVGGDPSQGTVRLTGRAPSGGIYIAVGSSSPGTAAISPSPAFVPAGSDTTTFNIATNAVGSTTNVVISASTGDGSDRKQATLTVKPQPKPDLYIYTAFFCDGNGNQQSAPSAGRSTNLCINVVNGGAASAGSSTVHAELFQSGTPVSTIKTWDTGAPALNPGGGTIVMLDVPALSSGFTYDFNIYLDASNAVAESSESNNYGHIQLTL